MVCMSWLQAGVGLWYAQQHGLADMAAAYQQLAYGMRSMRPSAVAKEAWNDEREIDWLLELRSAVLLRTREVVQDPQQLGLLVERLEATNWLQESWNGWDFRPAGWTTEEDARMLWVVDATSFMASGGVVLGPGMQSGAAAAAAPSAAAAGTSGEASTSATAASSAAGSSSPGEGGGTGSSSGIPALALPPQAMRALDMLAHVLLAYDVFYKVQDIITRQDLELFELLLHLGLPTAHHGSPLECHGQKFTVLEWAIRSYDTGRRSSSQLAADKAAAVIKVSVSRHGLRQPLHRSVCCSRTCCTCLDTCCTVTAWFLAPCLQHVAGHYQQAWQSVG
jgi:hypothetical protein